MSKLAEIQQAYFLPTTTSLLRLFHVIATTTTLSAYAKVDYDPYQDLYLIHQKTTSLEGRQLCRDLGYDGLAVLRSEEAYNIAFNLTKSYRNSDNDGIHIGATFCPSQRKIMWDDGKVVNDYRHFGTQPSKIRTPNVLKVYLGSKGFLFTNTLDNLRASLCGHYAVQPIQGNTVLGRRPEVQDANLSSVISGVNYFLLCVSLCGSDNSCAAAELNSDLLTCTTFQAGAFSNFTQNISVTFLKN